jgi:DNA polymerase
MPCHIDFETYSEAGYTFDVTTGRWRGSVPESNKTGIGLVGAAVYSEHASTEVISLAYTFPNDSAPRLWIPGMPAPVELYQYIATGAPVYAWNSLFEYYIWANVCHARMGWPSLPLDQLRDAMAQARTRGLPGKLENAGRVLSAPVQKLTDGARLLSKFSMPRNPTARDSRTRIHPNEHAADAAALYHYNMTDVLAEASVSDMLPELPPDEVETWLLDQRINVRGVAIDRPALELCMSVVWDATAALTNELQWLTGGAVSSASELAKMRAWLDARNVPTPSLDADAVKHYLKRTDLPPDARRVVEIRDVLSASSVAKLSAISATMGRDDRVRDLFMYHGAGTGRWAGRGAQPQNMPAGGPPVAVCQCGQYHAPTLAACPACGATVSRNVEWGPDAAESALATFARGGYREGARVFGDALWAVSGCLRGLFVAAPGCDLISSDYSAIEAVVLAALAGETWRLEVFATHGMIYETSAAKITGRTVADYIAHRKQNGEHHPDRKKGKVAELASGYGGGLGAWQNFGADTFMTVPEIRAAIEAWRKESPAIVAMWYGLEDAARLAIENPGQAFGFRSIAYQVGAGVLYCRLPSGRLIAYNSPRLVPDVTPWGKSVKKIIYNRVDPLTNQWSPADTYGGKLTENVVQAVSRDILAHAMHGVEAAGYPIVLHVHDEIVAEVPAGFGSVAEFETIMAALPAWATGWPLRATGGWRGRRYRKG